MPFAYCHKYVRYYFTLKPVLRVYCEFDLSCKRDTALAEGPLLTDFRLGHKNVVPQAMIPVVTDSGVYKILVLPNTGGLSRQVVSQSTGFSSKTPLCVCWEKTVWGMIWEVLQGLIYHNHGNTTVYRTRSVGLLRERVASPRSCRTLSYIAGQCLLTWTKVSVGGGGGEHSCNAIKNFQKH